MCHGRARLAVSLVCLLGSATTAHAECAWVRWKEVAVDLHTDLVLTPNGLVSGMRTKRTAHRWETLGAYTRDTCGAIKNQLFGGVMAERVPVVGKDASRYECCQACNPPSSPESPGANLGS